MNKLEQRLIDLTKQLGTARLNKDQAAIEDLEDQIAELEYDLEQEYNQRYNDHDDY